jgi:3-methyladenine DNA glycosylase/8-oxoguanine DNA glycosylase
MNDLELSMEQTRSEISKWMAELFDKDVHVDDVKKHVSKLTEKIVAEKLKGTKITTSVFKTLCKAVEDDSNNRRKANS